MRQGTRFACSTRMRKYLGVLIVVVGLLLVGRTAEAQYAHRVDPIDEGTEITNIGGQNYGLFHGWTVGDGFIPQTLMCIHRTSNNDLMGCWNPFMSYQRTDVFNYYDGLGWNCNGSDTDQLGVLMYINLTYYNITNDNFYFYTWVYDGVNSPTTSNVEYFDAP